MALTVWSFVNCKGGVGKTSISVNIAAILACKKFGKRILFLDVDPQCSASKWIMGEAQWREVNEQHNHRTVYQVFHDAAFQRDNFDFPESVVNSLTRAGL